MSDTFLSENIDRDKVQRIKKKDKDKADGSSSSQDPTLFRHNLATLFTTLADVVGSPATLMGSGKARALSCVPTVPSNQADSPLVPLSPYLVQRPKDLSETLAETDPEGEWGTWP